MDIPTITIDPRAAHTHTVVFLHGRGDNAQRFSSRVRSWRDSPNRTFADAFPSFRWVFPQAPLRKCSNLPYHWHQWFDVWSVEDFAEKEEIQAEGLKEVVPAIRSILENEANLLGGRWDRVILAGISMGGATGVHALFNLDIPASGGGRLGAFIGVACRCPLAGRSLLEMRRVLGLEGVPEHAEVLRNTPILMEHNADDGTVWIEKGRGLRDILREFGAQVEWREYPGGGHWFNSPSGMDDVVEFLNKYVMVGQVIDSEDVDMVL